MPKIVDDSRRRKGVTITLEQRDIDGLDKYCQWMEDGAASAGYPGTTFTRQAILERLVKKHLREFDRTLEEIEAAKEIERPQD